MKIWKLFRNVSLQTLESLGADKFLCDPFFVPPVIEGVLQFEKYVPSIFSSSPGTTLKVFHFFHINMTDWGNLGIVLQTQFQFTCLEWRDENDEVYRNVSEDGAPQNLMYEYRVFVPQSPSTEIPSQCSDYSLLGRSKTDVSEPTLLVFLFR